MSQVNWKDLGGSKRTRLRDFNPDHYHYGPAALRPRQQGKLARSTKDEEHAMPHKLNSGIAVIGIDIGKNCFHVAGHDKHGAIVLRD
jgi:hypothetical protein